MSKTYDEAVIAWAYERFPVEVGTVELGRVHIGTETVYHGYCNTCSYEEEVYTVNAYDINGFSVFSLNLPGYYDFAMLVKEILAA